MSARIHSAMYVPKDSIVPQSNSVCTQEQSGCLGEGWTPLAWHELSISSRTEGSCCCSEVWLFMVTFTSLQRKFIVKWTIFISYSVLSCVTIKAFKSIHKFHVLVFQKCIFQITGDGRGNLQTTDSPPPPQAPFLLPSLHLCIPSCNTLLEFLLR